MEIGAKRSQNIDRSIHDFKEKEIHWNLEQSGCLRETVFGPRLANRKIKS